MKKVEAEILRKAIGEVGLSGLLWPHEMVRA